MRSFAIIILAGVFLLATSISFAACPVGKKEGDTWCKDGREWKCEKCGSEYCEIMTGNSCLKDDVRNNNFMFLDNSEVKRTNQNMILAYKDCRDFTDCYQRCQCQYDNCIDGCNSNRTCENKCIDSWKDCTESCQ